MKRGRFGEESTIVILKGEGRGRGWDAVAHAREYHGRSERRGCNLVGVGRRVIRYRSSRRDDGPNQPWSLDFVSDTLTGSRRFRILCVVDTSLSGVRSRGSRRGGSEPPSTCPGECPRQVALTSTNHLAEAGLCL